MTTGAPYTSSATKVVSVKSSAMEIDLGGVRNHSTVFKSLSMALNVDARDPDYPTDTLYYKWLCRKVGTEITDRLPVTSSDVIM